MVLSNIEIQRAIDTGQLVLDPEPRPRTPVIGQYCPYDTHSVDLSLGPEISVPEAGVFAYDLTQPGSVAEQIAKHSRKYRLDPHQPFRLQPNQFILGRTRETVGLPIIAGKDICLAARVEGKSSRARCGLLVHFTAPTVHPGWRGALTLEMINLGPAPILLVPGMPIAQLIVEEVRGLPFENLSQFQGQLTPEGSV